MGRFETNTSLLCEGARRLPCRQVDFRRDGSVTYGAARASRWGDLVGGQGGSQDEQAQADGQRRKDSNDTSNADPPEPPAVASQDRGRLDHGRGRRPSWTGLLAGAGTRVLAV